LSSLGARTDPRRNAHALVQNTLFIGIYEKGTLVMDADKTSTNSAKEVVMSDPSTPILTDPSPSAVIASLNKSIQSTVLAADATTLDTNHLLIEPIQEGTVVTTGTIQSTIISTSTAEPSPINTTKGAPTIEKDDVKSARPSIRQSTVPPNLTGGEGTTVSTSDSTTVEASEESIVMDSGTATRGKRTQYFRTLFIFTRKPSYFFFLKKN
jgi:hypothetical protein